MINTFAVVLLLLIAVRVDPVINNFVDVEVLRRFFIIFILRQVLMFMRGHVPLFIRLLLIVVGSSCGIRFRWFVIRLGSR